MNTIDCKELVQIICNKVNTGQGDHEAWLEAERVFHRNLQGALHHHGCVLFVHSSPGQHFPQTRETHQGLLVIYTYLFRKHAHVPGTVLSTIVPADIPPGGSFWAHIEGEDTCMLITLPTHFQRGDRICFAATQHYIQQQPTLKFIQQASKEGLGLDGCRGAYTLSVFRHGSP